LEEDRQRWNRKYEKHDYPQKPSQIVKDFFVHATPGKALDIATGMGRNAYFLAQNGFEVEAVDISDIAINQFRNGPENLHSSCVDLDTFIIPKERYNLILNIRFLNRKFFPQMINGLVPGGVIIFETYLMGDKGSKGGPSCKDYMLQPNELLRAFSGLRILFYREALVGGGGRPIASLVAVKGNDCKLMPTPR
jgi:tellurite methyltransferase